MWLGQKKSRKIKQKPLLREKKKKKKQEQKSEMSDGGADKGKSPAGDGSSVTPKDITALLKGLQVDAEERCGAPLRSFALPWSFLILVFF
jgi:hypothetical protein